jgi:hypothetical protein
MLFKKKDKDIKYFNFPLDKKVELYFELFIQNWIKRDQKANGLRDEIQSIIFQELDSYEFNKGRWQIKREKTNLGIQKLHSELGHQTGIWNIDWAWIMHHIILDFLNINIAMNLLNEHGNEKVFVYKFLPEKYYDFAKAIYLKDTLSREPRVFELQKLLRNGNGFYLSQKNIKPIIGVTLLKEFDNDFWDLMELKEFKTDFIWNSENKCFDYKPFFRKIKRNSVIKIYQIEEQLRYR